MDTEKLSLARILICGALVVGFAPLASAADEAVTIGKLICFGIGAGASEWIAGQEGHALQIVSATCRGEGGLTDGGVMTQSTIWEMNKGSATALSGDGVLRKPAGILVYRLTAGSRSLIMTDGKVSGWTASGKGVYTMATGSMAPLANKNFSWTARPTGFNQYVIDSVLD